MQFDITHLDKKLVIQTLFSHAKALGYGKAEYKFRKQEGDNVDGLTDEECDEILTEFNNLSVGHLKLLDYHKGKPIKLTIQKKKDGRILVDTGSYDSRNGEYRFFEALLDIFSMDEIFITKKGYREFEFSDLQDHLKRPKEEIKQFKALLKNSYKVEKNSYKYWLIDETKAMYKSNYAVS